MTESERYLTKARESLASAEADVAAGRHNSAANRAYYAAFQAAVAALAHYGVSPDKADWRHRFVISQFSSKLIRRRKVSPTNVRGTLSVLFNHRVMADYRADNVSERMARSGLKLASELLAQVTTALASHRIGESSREHEASQMRNARASRAIARKRVIEIQQIILARFPGCDFEVVEFGPRDYRMIVHGGFEDAVDIDEVLDGCTSDILVDDDIWIVVLPQVREAA